MPPKLVSQSADLRLLQGEVGTLSAIFAFPNGNRAVNRKVWAHESGRFVYSVRPPVDPDADATEHLDHTCEAIFVVDVLATS